MRRFLLGGMLAIAAACGASGCRTPARPTPVQPPPDPGPVVSNPPPTIGAFRVQGSRTNAPPNFADLSEEVEVTVTVTDAESQPAALRFTWSAAMGTFSGSGAAVRWKAPPAAPTPMNVTLNLEVIETFTSQGRAVENKVTGSTTVALRNSAQEVGDLSRQFLLDFSDSTLSVTHVMRNFQPGCYGTAAETGDVRDNRDDFTIIESHVGAATTTVGFGGSCPFRNRAGDACSRIPVFWRSRAKRDLYDSRGRLVLRAGEEDEARGVNQLAAVYDRTQQSWKLCDSSWDSGATSLKAPIRGMVP